MNKPRLSVVCAALLAILLLAGAVCVLHDVNAVSLRGTAAVQHYVLTDGVEEELMLIVEDPWTKKGIVHVEGALMRMNQCVGAVNMRVGLIPEGAEGNGQSASEVILLNTQMVRRLDLAGQYGCDDHCGFHAAVAAKALGGEGMQYRIVMIDETDGEKRMLDTEIEMKLIQNELVFKRVNVPGEEAQNVQ